MKSVAVFGAGVAGLSAAHEFAKLGYRVSVYETNSDAGGFFRSARNKVDNGMPSEYSWHGIGPWYHNVFDVMKQIPFDNTGSVYDVALSRPIAFGIVPDKIGPKFDKSYIFTRPKALRMSRKDELALGWGILKTWTANRRTTEIYARKNASEYWKPHMSDKGWKTWRSIFGPWIGSDWANASLHHVGLFFRKNLMAGHSHTHLADDDGPAWTHGSRDGWLLLKGPSSEWWFDKWIKHLTKSGVQFFWEEPLQKFTYDGNVITAANLASGAKVQASFYVLATTPFATVDILKKTPKLAEEEELRKFVPLTQDGPHTQVSFRIAFSKQIKWEQDRSAVIIGDSEFNITLFAEEQVWSPKVKLGSGVKSLWTGTACVSNVPGRIYHKTLNTCTKEQFIEEVKIQILECEGLDFMIRQANDNQSLTDFPIIRIEVWHEWFFSPKGIRPKQPKWVTTTNTQPYLPAQKTSIPNLVLAGAHTKTEADVWSIEGAVESGRRAAQVVEPSVVVIPEYKSLLLKTISTIDDALFAIRAPHILDIFCYLCISVAIISIILFFSGR